MASPAKPIPEGLHTLTAYLVVRDAGRFIEFCKRAFGAEEVMRMAAPGGKGVAHAELKIGDSILMLCEEMPMMKRWVSPESLGGTTVALSLYVPDADTVFERAVAAGATVSMPLADQFWGDRYGRVVDPSGHEWSIATHKKDLTPEEIGKAAEVWFSQLPPHKS